MTSRKQGFTLIELSMVLLIIGFVMGVIVIGHNMIRTAQLRYTVGTIAKYTQAVGVFKDAYQGVPGDFKGAETLWGSDITCPNTPTTTVPHTATCDGNGNGYIETTGEWARAWQQLSNAGLVDGTFTGVTGSGGTTEAKVGINVPQAQLAGVGYTLLFVSAGIGGDATYWSYMNNHVFFFGRQVTGSYTWGPGLTPVEALEIDIKADDGIPSTGNVLSLHNGSLPNCGTTDVASTVRYNASYGGLACSLMFVTAY